MKELGLASLRLIYALYFAHTVCTCWRVVAGLGIICLNMQRLSYVLGRCLEADVFLVGERLRISHASLGSNSLVTSRLLSAVDRHD
jgi:hypothetical protein